MGGVSYRVQELMEDDYNGWTATKVSAASNTTQTVYTGRCTFAWLRVLTAIITVTPKDNTTAIFDAITSAAELDLSHTPLKVETSLKLTFSAGGTAWVVYKPRV